MATQPQEGPALVPRLSSIPASAACVLSQANESRTGHDWPELAVVRTILKDSKADAVNAKRAAKVEEERFNAEHELNHVLVADDCHHTYVESEGFMPGIETFLYACGTLFGFEFMNRAESPPHVLAALVQHFPLLPKVTYFDTACQIARYASRRVPWLVGLSDAASAVDGVHNVGKHHKCSDIFDADVYPSRSLAHSTAVAESRPSISKVFSTHLSQLRHDHFIIQMRLLAGTINLRVLMRRKLEKYTQHQRMAAFFDENVVKDCERQVCSSDKAQLRRADQLLSRAGDGAAVDADPEVGGGGQPPPPPIHHPVLPARDEGLVAVVAEGDDDPSPPSSQQLAAHARADGARGEAAGRDAGALFSYAQPPADGPPSPGRGVALSVVRPGNPGSGAAVSIGAARGTVLQAVPQPLAGAVRGSFDHFGGASVLPAPSLSPVDANVAGSVIHLVDHIREPLKVRRRVPAAAFQATLPIPIESSMRDSRGSSHAEESSEFSTGGESTHSLSGSCT